MILRGPHAPQPKPRSNTRLPNSIYKLFNYKVFIVDQETKLLYLVLKYKNQHQHNMIFDPAPIELPVSYETVPTTGQIKVSHYPAGASSVTPVIVVTLNRPANNNAFTSQMVKDFEKFFPMFDVDERVKVIVLTGAGKIFCAGADLDIGFSSNRERPADHRDG